MKKKTLVLASVLALGTIIAPLAGCGSDKPKEQTVVSTVKVNIEGVDESAVKVTYDAASIEPNTFLNFTVVSQAEDVTITEVKFNGQKLESTSGAYTGLVITGENTITVKAHKEEAKGLTIRTVIEGTAEKNVQVEFKNDPKPGEKLQFEVKLAKDVRIRTIFFNDSLIKLDDQNIYEVWTRAGENVLVINATYEGKLQPTLNDETVLFLEGGKEFALKKVGSSNLFESEPINIEFNSLFGVFHKEGKDYKNYAQIYNINDSKSFAPINVQATTEGEYKDLSLSIGGGATYKFYLDLDLDLPLYAVRTKVTTLPATQDELRNLLNNVGSGYGASTNLRSDIAKVDVNATTRLMNGTKYKEISTYERYSDTTSVNKLEVLVGQEASSSLVYNEIRDGVLYTVDTLNDQFGQDSHADKISYKKKVVEKYSEDQRHEITSYEASKAITNPVRNQGSIGELIRNYYRASGVKDAAKITSVETSTGFKTTINTRRIVQLSSTAQNEVAELSQGEVTFLIDGSLKDVKFKTYQFDGNKFDFSKGELKPNVAFDSGVLLDDVTATITYGLDHLPVKPDEVDTYIPTYFIQSVDNVIMKNNKIGYEGNNLYPDVRLVFDEYIANTTMKIEFTPSTALDKADYGILASDNEAVVGRINGSRDFYTKHIDNVERIDSANVTVGNYINNKIAKTVKVTVYDQIELKSLWFANPIDTSYNYDYLDKNLAITANSAVLMLGKKYSIQIAGTSKASLKDLNVVGEGTVLDLVSNPTLKSKVVTRSYGENNTMFLDIDLSLINTEQYKDFTEPKTLKVTFNSPLFDGADGNKGVFTFKVFPEVTKEDLFGTWENVLIGGTGTKFTSRLTISNDKIEIYCPEAYEYFELNKYNTVCKYKVGKNEHGEKELWDMIGGTYGVNADVVLEGSETAKEQISLDFTTFFYHPVQKKLAVILTLTVGKGLDNVTYDPIIGDYDGSAELLSKIA